MLPCTGGRGTLAVTAPRNNLTIVGGSSFASRWSQRQQERCSRPRRRHELIIQLPRVMTKNKDSSEGVISDLVLIVEGKRLLTRRFVLARSSPVFKSLLLDIENTLGAPVKETALMMLPLADEYNVA
eukprot:jgi/Chlat1/5951/Chrsp4S06420